MRPELRIRAVAAGLLLAVTGLALAPVAAADDATAPAAEPSAPASSASPTGAPSSAPSPGATATSTPTATPTTTTTPTASPTATPTATPTDPPVDGPVETDDAVLRWGVSNEANNAAFAPGTYNFFSAGKIRDPGRANVMLTEAAWSQRAGAVTIEKFTGTSWKPATWAGRTSDSNGVAITPTSGRYSNHQVVFSGGTGTIDRAAGTARITWTGDVTVLLYSGYSFFYLSDPVLEVVDGKGTLTGTLSGYATAQGSSQWTQVPARTVRLADLPSVSLGTGSFTATPAYAGVRVTGVDQAAPYGSFPQQWIDFTNLLGTAAFWHSSGSSIDAGKPALPLTVGWSGRVTTPTPSVPETATPTVDNSAPLPPGGLLSGGFDGFSAPNAAPPQALDVASGGPTALGPASLSPTVQLVSAAAPSAVTSPQGSAPDRSLWLVGCGLLALSGPLLLRLVLPRS